MTNPAPAPDPAAAKAYRCPRCGGPVTAAWTYPGDPSHPVLRLACRDRECVYRPRRAFAS